MNYMAVSLYYRDAGGPSGMTSAAIWTRPVSDDLLRSLVRQVSLEHFGYGLLSSGTYTQQAIPRI